MKITETELKSILEAHKLWLETAGNQGKRANLRSADLTRANLSGADLTYADLENADLTGAYLFDANLTGANLERANLSYANLTDADLTGAYLFDADLTDANLTDANLTTTILDKKKEVFVEKVAKVEVTDNSSIRSKFDEFAKKHGMKIEELKLSLL